MIKHKWYFFCIVILLVILFSFTGCPGTTPAGGTGGGGTGASDGKVTVNLSNADWVNGDEFFAFVYAANEKSINTAAKLIATNNTSVAGGTATFVIEEDDGSWMPNGTDWTGSGGTTYDIYIYSDNNNDGDHEPANSDRSYRTDPYPVSVTIDGDQTVNVDYNNMVDYTGGTYTVALINGAEDDVLTVAAFLSGADPDNDDYLGAATDVIAADGSAEVTVEVSGDPWYAIDGFTFDIYIFIDEDGNEEPDTGELVYDTFPLSHIQSGNTNSTLVTDATINY